MYIDAMRFWIQAEAELETASLLIKRNKYYASIIHAHRAVEWSLKSLYAELYNDNPPETNDIIELYSKLHIDDKDFEELIIQLDIEYSAKYSDTYNASPTYLITRKTAERNVENAMRLLEISKKYLR
jgi:HEPN domain-containing protein